MKKTDKIVEICGANYSKQNFYPLVNLNIERTGRQDAHAYRIGAYALACNSTREVNVYLTLDQLRVFAREILQKTAQETADVE
jgi:hypothetical protein